jgi:hypothetical protein
VIDSSDEGFEKPSDEDAQGNVCKMRQMEIDGEDDTKQTLSQSRRRKTSITLARKTRQMIKKI